MTDILAKYADLFQFYEDLGIKHQKSIEYLSPLIISTQSPFKIKSATFAQLGDSYISHLVTVTLIDAGYEPGNVQLFISTNLSNKVFSDFVKNKGWNKYCSTWDKFQNDKILGTFFESVIGFFYIRGDYGTVAMITDSFFEFIEEKTGDNTMFKNKKRVQVELIFAYNENNSKK